MQKWLLLSLSLVEYLLLFSAQIIFLGHKINKKILCKKPTHGCDNGICMGVNYIFSLKKINVLIATVVVDKIHHCEKEISHLIFKVVCSVTYNQPKECHCRFSRLQFSSAYKC